MSNRFVRRCIAESLENRMLLSFGDLDSRFSGDGVVTLNFQGGFDNAHGVAVQGDGKVIVVGDASVIINGAQKTAMAAVRYNADGTLDDGGANDSTPGDHFGTGGKFTYFTGLASFATAIAIQRDGKIVIAGTEDTGGEINQQAWLIVRLNADGSFDKTFNGTGKSGLQFSIYNTPLTAIALQSDGKIVAVGSFSATESPSNSDWLVGRFNTDGTLDTDFDGGTVTTDFGGNDQATGVAIDNIGNIVVGGSGTANASRTPCVARYQPDGSLDPNFGTNGTSFDTFSSQTAINNLIIKPDGTIVFGATQTSLGGTLSFDHDGTSNGGGFSGGITSNAIALMPNGEYVSGGENIGFDTPVNRFEMFTQNSGSNHGFFPVAHSVGTAITVAPDGSIFEAGYADPNSGERDFVLAKFIGIDPKSWGAVSGNVFRDLDNDHVQDSNEKGMGNVAVYADFNNDGLLDARGEMRPPDPSVLTDSHGNFSLKNLSPGTYVIREVVPAGYTQTLPTNISYSVTVAGAKTVKGANFSNGPIVAPSIQTAVNGSVFHDWNSNGVRDISKPTEPDLTGIGVFIDSNKNGVYDKHETLVRTDAGGNFVFNFTRGGSLRIAVAPPTGFTNSTTAFYDVTVPANQQVTKRFGLTLLDTNDTIAESTPIAMGKAVSGTISSPLDVNMYRFTVTAGQTISFDEDAAKGSSLEAYLRLFDSKGHQLAANDNAAAKGESVSLDSALKFKFTTAGTYYIAVSDHLNIAYSANSGAGDVGTGTKGKYALTLS
jgi:uncharacterized delta-60 repeat protein